MSKNINYRDALKELVLYILETEAGREIDAGCDGEGPLAIAMVQCGISRTTSSATKRIYGADYE